MIKAGVVGWPIEQSKSPIIHNYWLDKYNINGSYKKISLSPENFKLGIKRLMNDGYAGLNITVPHKEMALEISSNPTERAKKIGAANTLIFKKGKIYADNTDGIGFLNNLTQLAPDWKADLGPAVVLGAGGASRSIVSLKYAIGILYVVLSVSLGLVQHLIFSSCLPSSPLSGLFNPMACFSSLVLFLAVICSICLLCVGAMLFLLFPRK